MFSFSSRLIDTKKRFKVKGKIKESLPGTKFRVEIDIQGQIAEVLCHLSGKMRMHYIRLNIGDEVEVEISPYDLTKGIIVYRL